MSYELGDRERAQTLHENVVRRARELGNERMQATSLGALAEYALYDRRVEDAVPMLEEAYRINRDVGERYEIAVTVYRFARALAIEGKAQVAAQLLSCSEALHEEIGLAVSSWLAEMNEGTRAIVHTDLDQAAFAEALEQGATLTADEAVALALESLD
jgi:hypothetical protein